MTVRLSLGSDHCRVPMLILMNQIENQVFNISDVGSNCSVSRVVKTDVEGRTLRHVTCCHVQYTQRYAYYSRNPTNLT